MNLEFIQINLTGTASYYKIRSKASFIYQKRHKNNIQQY